MLPRWSSLLRLTALTAGALVLSFGGLRSGYGQIPDQDGSSAGYGLEGRSASSATPARGGQVDLSTSTRSVSSAGRFVPEYFEVTCPGGFYGGAFHFFCRRAFAGGGYGGFFRRYWGYGYYGPNYNMGLVDSRCGINGFLYAPTRRCHGLTKHGADYSVFPCDLGATPPAGGMNPGAGGMNPPAPPAAQPSRAPAEQLPPPTTNRAHLQLLVPDKAEVRVEGVKTSKTGTVRDFVSPPLTPGTNMTYKIAVRYTDANGKPIEETHSVRVRANDRLRIDCTGPATAEPMRAAVLRP